MSFLSFFASLLPTRFVADNTQTDAANEIDEQVAIMEQSDGFPLFLRLPAELREMIINEALYEHEESVHRVVLLDPQTYRISPTQEIAGMASPLLFVSTEFRSVALKVYKKVDVFRLDAPGEDQYGNEMDWYLVPLNRDYLYYNESIRDQIEEELEYRSIQKGCLYINPKSDTFVTGSVPRQVAHSIPFRSRPVGSPQPWKTPRDFVTAQLAEDTCAKITTMREVEWDLDVRCLGCGTCLLCGRVGRLCCTENFFDERGEHWVPFYSRDVFTGIESFGYYLLTAGDDMEQFFYDFTVMGGKACVEEEWKKKYLEFDLERLPK